MCPWNYFPQKTKKCLMFLSPAFRYLLGVLREEKIFICEVNSHTKILKSTWSDFKCFPFLLKKKKTYLSLLPRWQHPSLLFFELLLGWILWKKEQWMFTQILYQEKSCEFPNFMFYRHFLLTTNVLFSVSHLLFIIILLIFSVFILGSRNNK